jgi:dihydrofolate reductase
VTTAVLHGKQITIIAAMARNRGIGLGGDMPWHLPGELKHFKQTTMGKPIVMGRKTWESIGRPLPGRQNIVVTRNRAFQAEGCDVADSLDSAVEAAVGPEVMIIGGGQLYELGLPFSDRMILTLVDCEPDADTWFPNWEGQGWRRVGSRSEKADEHNPHAFEVLELVRKNDSDGNAPEPGTAVDLPT